MKNIRFFILMMVFVFGCNAAYVVLKDGNKGRINIPETADLFDSTKSSFFSMNKNGNYVLLKKNVEYLVIDDDTLRFSGNVAQVVKPVNKNDILDVDEIIDESLVSDPADNTTKEPEAADRTIVIGINNHKNGSRFQKELEHCRNVSRTGAIIFGVGMAIEYGIALPLNINAVSNGNEGLAIAAVVVSLAGNGFLISGPIRSGVGASMAYDASRRYCLGLDKNINWVFYKVGWVLNGVNALLSLVSNFDTSAAAELTLPSLILGAVSNAMFITSVANASGYTRKALNKVDKTTFKIDLVPVVSYNQKRAGLVLNCFF